jgi:hypothetical protein
MADLPIIVLILLGLLAWLLLAVAVVLLVVVLPRWRRTEPVAPEQDEGMERRRRAGDRRIGLPDTREVKIERRSGFDRRRGPAAMA